MIVWRFEIPGQPPSWNASYKIVKQYRSTASGASVPFHTLAKKEKVIQWQQDAVFIIRSAKPSRWHPEWQIRVFYWFYLSRDMDCDNILKAVNDAIEMATEVDDKRYLPCVVEKHIVPKKNAMIAVQIEDPGSPSVALPFLPTTLIR
jgi:Holliday junction resolvase RusA-like endonuclease